MTMTAPRPAPLASEGPGACPLLDGQHTTGEQLLVKVFVVLPLLALLAAVPLAWKWGLSWTDIGLAVFYYVSGLGATVTSPTAGSRLSGRCGSGWPSRLLHAGHLPTIRVARSLRIPRQAVETYVRTSTLHSSGT